MTRAPGKARAPKEAAPGPETRSGFGRHRLEEWALDPAITYLNHGTVGAPPRRVLDAQHAIRLEIERQPARFLLRELSEIAVGGPRAEPPRLRAAAESVARFLGARGPDLVFTDNATAGVNAVLRSLDLRPGDEILITDRVYGGVGNAAAFAARTRDARVRVVALPHPFLDPGRAVDAVRAALGPRARVLVVEHITAESALLLPVAAIAAACRARGVAVLVDGAHAPGAVAVDIPSLGADWYAGNLHKWAYAPRSCGILWAAPGRQRGLHPGVVSWGLDRGFTAEFDWAGTRDPSAWLAAPEGIAFLESMGAASVRAYNHALAWSAAEILTRRWGTERPAAESAIATMVTVPLPERLGGSAADAALLRDELLFEEKIEVQVHAWRGRLWARVSAQIYNEERDVLRLSEAVAKRA